jgi:mono/diheme cytochrome c family protein
MRCWSAIFVVALTLGSCLAAYTAERPKAALAPGPPPGSYEKAIAPLFARYCGACHGEKVQTAGINFKQYSSAAAVVKASQVWEKVGQALESHQMPPKGLPAPTPAQRDQMVSWIQATLSQAGCDLKDPGRVTMRRLNRAEYNNTIRDLVGVNFRPADDFPTDDVGYGFDNIGDVLSLSPLLVEKYLNAAEKITKAAIVVPEAAGPTQKWEAEKLAGGEANDASRILASTGEILTGFEAAKDGEYLLRARAFGQQAGPEPARMEFRVDGKPVRLVDVTAVEGAPEVYQLRLRLPSGKHQFAVAFTNDYYRPDDPNPENRDRNLGVDYLEVVGPLESPTGELPASHQQIFICQPTAATRDECARKILANFARRAYRRPVTATEVERLVRIAQLARAEGESFERGIQLAVQAALVSPHFLFRVEIDPSPNNPEAHPISDYELAARLSYFLWSSMPDETLFQLAAKKQLRKPEVLEAQARRMLKDSKARSLVENFGEQWLTLRNLKSVSPDPKRFPAWNDGLRADMLKETALFFEAIMREDRSVLDFLDGKFTFLNERLAKLYGIDGVQGEQFRKVALAGDQRMGVLTQASILTVTSNPTRTSPVKRGKWVLEQILGTPPPPPPPDVPELKEAGMLTGTLRQRMEQHRKDPGCASCHARLDPLGFGLENFDAVGAWRTQDGDAPIDASGTLPNGKSFAGPAQLIAILKGQKNQFVKNLSAMLLTYALGRGMEETDRCAVDTISAGVAGDQYRFSALVVQIVKSEPFRMRRGEGEAQR